MFRYEKFHLQSTNSINTTNKPNKKGNASLSDKVKKLNALKEQLKDDEKRREQADIRKRHQFFRRLEIERLEAKRDEMERIRKEKELAETRRRVANEDARKQAVQDAKKKIEENIQKREEYRNMTKQSPGSIKDDNVKSVGRNGHEKISSSDTFGENTTPVTHMDMSTSSTKDPSQASDPLANTGKRGKMKNPWESSSTDGHSYEENSKGRNFEKSRQSTEAAMLYRDDKTPTNSAGVIGSSERINSLRKVFGQGEYQKSQGNDSEQINRMLDIAEQEPEAAIRSLHDSEMLKRTIKTPQTVTNERILGMEIEVENNGEKKGEETRDPEGNESSAMTNSTFNVNAQIKIAMNKSTTADENSSDKQIDEDIARNEGQRPQIPRAPSQSELQIKEQDTPLSTAKTTEEKQNSSSTEFEEIIEYEVVEESAFEDETIEIEIIDEDFEQERPMQLNESAHSYEYEVIEETSPSDRTDINVVEDTGRKNDASNGEILNDSNGNHTEDSAAKSGEISKEPPRSSEEPVVDTSTAAQASPGPISSEQFVGETGSAEEHDEQQRNLPSAPTWDSGKDGDSADGAGESAIANSWILPKHKYDESAFITLKSSPEKRRGSRSRSQSRGKGKKRSKSKEKVSGKDKSKRKAKKKERKMNKSNPSHAKESWLPPTLKDGARAPLVVAQGPNRDFRYSYITQPAHPVETSYEQTVRKRYLEQGDVEDRRGSWASPVTDEAQHRPQNSEDLDSNFTSWMPEAILATEASDSSESGDSWFPLPSKPKPRSQRIDFSGEIKVEPSWVPRSSKRSYQIPVESKKTRPEKSAARPEEPKARSPAERTSRLETRKTTSMPEQLRSESNDTVAIEIISTMRESDDSSETTDDLEAGIPREVVSITRNQVGLSRSESREEQPRREVQRKREPRREERKKTGQSQSTTGKKDKIQGWPYLRCAALVCLLLILPGALVATLVFFRESSGSDFDRVTNSTTTPAGLPCDFGEDDLLLLLSASSGDGGLALCDSTSPQYAAMEWVRTANNQEIFQNQRFLQRYALATLYFSLGGSAWTSDSSWLTSSNECEWYTSSTNEPICDEKGNIITVDLAGNNLKGRLPRELEILSRTLRNLRLSNNDISGVIPNSFGSLSKLTSLELSENELAGNIPTEFGSLSAMTRLSLSNNKLGSSIPTQIGSMLSLQSIDLGSNQLYGTIPSEIGGLTGLVQLSLYDNGITGSIPNELSNLNNLKSLFVERTSLNEAFSPQICDLSFDDFWSDCDEIVSCSCCTYCCIDGSNCFIQ